MPSASNYLINQEERLPTRVKRAVSDLFAMWELKAARVAEGVAPVDDVEQLFDELIQIVEQNRPDKAPILRANMRKPMLSYKYDRKYSAFATLDITRPDAFKSVDLIALHKPMVAPLRDSWVHIPPMLTNVDRVSPLIRPDLFIPQTEYRGLRFHLAKVKCFDETHGCGWWDPEWGEDEIYCGAVAVDENGQTSSGGLFKVGDFDDGDVRDYGFPGKQLQYFNIHEGGDTFPKIYTMAVALVEHDWGNLPEWFNKFLNVVREKVAEYLATLLGTAIGSSLGPLGSLIGAVIGWAVGKVFGLIKSWLDDEVLGTATIKATINSYSGNWMDSGTSMSGIYTRDYHGNCSHYRIYWRAELVA